MATNKKFFAMIDGAPTEILIFESKAERDAWTNYQDWEAKELGFTKENTSTRYAVTESDAVDIFGPGVLDDNNYEYDGMGHKYKIFAA